MGTATLGYPGGPAVAFRLDPESIGILMSMTDTHECSVSDCHDPRRRLQWCSKHYQRWRKHGDPLALKSRWDDHELVSLGSCSVDECEDPVLALKLCSKHYQRQQAHGDPLVVLKMGPARIDTDNYSTQHKRVTKDRGQPQRCEHCGTSDPELQYGWAFNHVGDRQNVADYIRLCRSCHWKFDFTPEALEQLARARAARWEGVVRDGNCHPRLSGRSSDCLSA